MDVVRLAAWFVLFGACVAPTGAADNAGGENAPTPHWPAAWVAAWSAPSAELRPLQIVHGVAPDRTAPASMAVLKELGLGGIVCNVSFSDYLVSDANWATLVRAVEACRDVGMIVWLYDEKGYPSGSAGGLVLKEHPEYEALALTYHPATGNPFVLRPAYEHTHASNNFCAARRYPNLIDDAAVRSFIEKTHEAYWRRLRPHFGATIRAFFTDEPSLMAVNIGQLGEKVRKNVPVEDPLDPSVEPLPSVPWVRDLPARYRERYGEDLMPLRRSLFAGDAASDRQLRRRFWALIADLTAERFFGRIQDWCRAHRIASSGHTLWEETPIVHVPLEGNALKALGRMDIPGLDMLSSQPETVLHGGWMSACLPASAALLNGRRLVMTEISDFSETIAGKPPASLAQMRAAAAWQAALGVTEFTLYYDRSKRTPKDYRAYGDFVGRVNAVLRDAQLDLAVLLYYPIYDLWAEYRPVAEKLTLETQSLHAQTLVNSFQRLGRHLVSSQVPFVLADHDTLASAVVRDGRLWIRDHGFTAVALPDGTALPADTEAVVAAFAKVGGVVLRDDLRVPPPAIDRATVRGIGITPACDRIVLGCFVRDRRRILLLVNVGTELYSGSIAVGRPDRWWLADPSTGGIAPAPADKGGRIRISLPERAAILLIGPM